MRNDFRLIDGDCFNELAKFKGEFDLIFADPPYFLSNGGLSIQSGQIVSVNKGKWDEGTNIDEIDEFNLKWLNLAKRSLSDNGSIMISGTYHNIFSIGRALQKLDYKILNIITWQKTNPPPNFSCRYLTHKHIFNYELMKRINGDKQMKDVWSFAAIAPWEKACGKHPTQKPLSLLIRLILMASNENSVICDPFAGSATTGIAANLLGRNFVGIEKEPEFVDIALKRKAELEANFIKFRDKFRDIKMLESLKFG